jgi:uncharacterized protein involved in copper resistance
VEPPLLGEALGDASTHQVWRVLRKHGIRLRRRWSRRFAPGLGYRVADSYRRHSVALI